MFVRINTIYITTALIIAKRDGLMFLKSPRLTLEENTKNCLKDIHCLTIGRKSTTRECMHSFFIRSKQISILFSFISVVVIIFVVFYFSRCYYFWNTITDEVSWLPPHHPNARISLSAQKLRSNSLIMKSFS
jgi:hypothetical protein